MKLPEEDSTEEKNKVDRLGDVSPNGTPLNRMQRRVKERIESEATAQLNRLQNRFMEFIINCENPGTDAEEKKKIISAQWKMYCNSKRFTEKARSVFDDWAVKVIEQYKVESNGA